MIYKLVSKLLIMKFISSFFLTKAIDFSRRISTSKRIFYSSLILKLLFLVVFSGCIQEEHEDLIEEEPKGWIELGPYEMVGNPVEIAGKIAFVSENDCNRFIVYNGKGGTHYDKIEGLQNINGKIAFNAMKNGKWMFVYDWNESGMLYDRIENAVEIGGKIAYLANKNGKNIIIYDGKEIGTQYDRISSYNPLDIGGKLTYMAEKNGTTIIVHGGKEIGTQYDSVWYPIDIGGNLTYKARKDRNWSIVSNFKEMDAKYQDIYFMMEIGGNLAFFAKNGSNYVAVNDGNEEIISSNAVGLMDIGGKIAYLAPGPMNKQSVVHDGNRGNPYDSISHLADINGKPAYWVRNNYKLFIVYDGRELGAQYDNAEQTFTHINGTIAYTAFKDGAWFVVYGDKEMGKQYDYAGSPSNVSGRLAYIARKNNSAFFVYDGEEIGAGNNYDDVKDLIEVNGKKAYMAAKNGKWFIVMEKYRGLEIEPQQMAGLNRTVEEKGYFLLVEEWHNTDGRIISGSRRDIPFRAIDFPMYDIEEGNKKIWVPFMRDDLKCLSNVKIIFGYGVSLDGDMGMGISSSLSTYKEFPFHVNRSGYSIDIISDDLVFINNKIKIPPGGQYSIISNSTEYYGNTVVQVQHTTTIKNYGNYSEDSIYTR